MELKNKLGVLRRRIETLAGDAWENAAKTTPEKMAVVAAILALMLAVGAFALAGGSR